jgi:hypothetical protein
VSCQGNFYGYGEVSNKIGATSEHVQCGGHSMGCSERIDIMMVKLNKSFKKAGGKKGGKSRK